jgi:hypothetical protein
MTSDIRDILSNKQFSEPKEFRIIRDFVQEKFQENVDLKLQNNTIVIGVKGSALAGELQLCLHDLKNKLNQHHEIRIMTL